MEIPPPSTATSSPVQSPGRPVELLNQLQPGQVLAARVERILSNGEAELKIGQQLLRVRSPISLAPGQPLNIKVDASAEGPLLRIAQQASQVETLARAYRAAIPKQTALAEVVNQLQKIIKLPVAGITSNTRIAPAQQTATTPTHTAPLPKSIQTAIGRLISQLPNVSTLSKPEGLKTAIGNAGPLLETRLHRGANTGQSVNTQADLKANFLRLARSLLQLQANQAPGTNTATPISPTAGQQTGGAGRQGIELYTALVQAAAGKPDTTAETNAPRPLLPSVPLPLPLAVQQQNPAFSAARIFATLPAFLSKLIPVSLTNTQHPSSQAHQAQATTSQQLHRLTAELLSQIESGLARIQQQQLNTLPGDDPVRTLVDTEFPIFNGQQYDNLAIQIESEHANNEADEKQHIWRATIRFTLPTLGSVQAVVAIKDHRVYMEFRSEQDTTTALFRQQISVLEQKLRDAGLDLAESTFSTGHISTAKNGVSGLLNTEA